MSWNSFDDDGWDDADDDVDRDEHEDTSGRGDFPGRRGDPAGGRGDFPGRRGDSAGRRGDSAGRREGDSWPLDEDDDLDAISGRWPLDPRGLYARERWLWYEQLWADACALRERYRLPLRSGWWEDHLQVEALAAIAAWTERYDSGEWDDPPGKLALLYDLERVSRLLRDGLEPFHPTRDRSDFLRYLIESGCQPPPQGPAMG